MKKVLALLVAITLILTNATPGLATKITTIAYIQALPPIGTAGPVSITGNSSSVSASATSSSTATNAYIIATVSFNIEQETSYRTPSPKANFQKRSSSGSYSTVKTINIGVPSSMINSGGGVSRRPTATNKAYVEWATGTFVAGTYRFQFVTGSVSNVYESNYYGFTATRAPSLSTSED